MINREKAICPVLTPDGGFEEFANEIDYGDCRIPDSYLISRGFVPTWKIYPVVETALTLVYSDAVHASSAIGAEFDYDSKGDFIKFLKGNMRSDGHGIWSITTKSGNAFGPFYIELADPLEVPSSKIAPKKPELMLVDTCPIVDFAGKIYAITLWQGEGVKA